MPVEVLLLEGKGSLQMTGQMGEVMQESAQAALSYLKSRAAQLRASTRRSSSGWIFTSTCPKAPSPRMVPAPGITMATALISAFTGRAVHRDVGMTGEITLRGRVLPIGGVREKVLARIAPG